MKTNLPKADPLSVLLFGAMRDTSDPALRHWLAGFLSNGASRRHRVGDEIVEHHTTPKGSMTALYLAAVLSDTALLVLAHAARRSGERVLPTKGVSGYTWASVLRMLLRLDLITDGPCPVLTDLGREVAAIYLGCTAVTHEENAP